MDYRDFLVQMMANTSGSTAAPSIPDYTNNVGYVPPTPTVAPYAAIAAYTASNPGGPAVGEQSTAGPSAYDVWAATQRNQAGSFRNKMGEILSGPGGKLAHMNSDLGIDMLHTSGPGAWRDPGLNPYGPAYQTTQVGGSGNEYIPIYNLASMLLQHVGYPFPMNPDGSQTVGSQSSARPSERSPFRRLDGMAGTLESIVNGTQGNTIQADVYRQQNAQSRLGKVADKPRGTPGQSQLGNQTANDYQGRVGNAAPRNNGWLSPWLPTWFYGHTPNEIVHAGEFAGMTYGDAATELNRRNMVHENLRYLSQKQYLPTLITQMDEAARRKGGSPSATRR